MIKKNKIILLVLFLFFNLYSHYDEIKNKIVVIIPSYNNEQWVEKNLLSLLSQKFDNYNVIYINDASTDNTKKCVEDFLTQYDVTNKVCIVNNSINRGNAANIWLTLHECNQHGITIDDWDIIVIYDGDDWYNNDYVLPFLYQIYATTNIMCTYGGYIQHPATTLGDDDFSLRIPACIVQNNAFRNFIRHSSQQRSMYAWMYRQIRLEDFFYEGKFLPASNDVAYMIALHEISGGRSRCLTYNNFYEYNRVSALNDDKVRAEIQRKADISVRHRKKYYEMNGPEYDVNNYDKNVDVVIFSRVIDKFVNKKLLSFTKCLNGYGKIYIISKKINPKYKNSYLKNGIYIYDSNNFKEKILSILEESTSSIAFFDIAFEIYQKIDLARASKMLQKTQAFCFDLWEHKDLVCEHLYLDVSAWQSCVDLNLVKKHAFNGKVYSRDLLLKCLSKISFNSLNTLTTEWCLVEEVCDPLKINLFFS